MKHLKNLAMTPCKTVERKLDSYQIAIEAALNHLIPASSLIALFDFPNHSNVGDSAIWLGEKAYLDERSDLKVIFHDSQVTLSISPPPLPQGTVILIHGGGNLGDLWPHHQNLRLKLLQSYPHHRIIQLPQSIHFQNKANFEKSKNVFRRHPDFHLLVRDRPSLEIGIALHDGNTHLCPDMALYLGKISRPCKAQHRCIALMRTDKERVVDRQGQNEEKIQITDWLNEEQTLSNKLTDKIDQYQGRYPKALQFLFRQKRWLYQKVATDRLLRGCTILSSGNVVITDRLHAHILCSMMSIPHVVLDNSYGKISNFIDAWQTGDGLCKRAESFDQAISLAKDMHTLVA